MSFFDYLMRGMGFEVETKPKKIEKEKTIASSSDASFDEISSIESKSINLGLSEQNKNVVIYNPKSQADIKKLIGFLRRGEPIIVNFSYLPKDICENMVSFISGALFALKGSLHPLGKDLYILTPEGVNVVSPNKE